MENITREKLQEVMQKKNFAYFEKGDFNVNIIGIRNLYKQNQVTNIFDDLITMSYKENGIWKLFKWECTTDPGTKAVKKFSNIKGVARLVPNQYRGSHEIRKHQGKYDALCQKGMLSVYRDGNKNMNFDEEVIDSGSNFGINIHHAGDNSAVVENWSEGCQVFKRKKDFLEFMKICYKAREIHGNSFTYTLLTSNDLK